VWNAATGQPISTPLVPNGGAVTSVAVSGNRIASATADGTAQLWDSDTGILIKNLGNLGGVVNSVAFSANGNRLATGGIDGTIRLWRADNGAAVATLPVGQPVYAVAFSPKGDRMAAASGDGQLTIWDAPAGTPRRLANTDHAVIFGIAFDAGGNRLASGGANGILRLWDASSGNQIWQHNVVDALSPSEKQQWASGHPGVITSVAFSPDGRLLASAGASYSSPNGWPLGMIQRWDAGSGAPAGRPIQVAGSGSAVMSVAFTPRADATGDRIVSGGVDRTVRLWNAKSGEQIGDAFVGPTEGVGTVAVSQDGQRILAGSADGTIRIWPDPPAAAPADALCAKLTENMNETQWRLWVSSSIDFVKLCPGLPQSAAATG
jgi:WD40 repeat protein